MHNCDYVIIIRTMSIVALDPLIVQRPEPSLGEGAPLPLSSGEQTAMKAASLPVVDLLPMPTLENHKNKFKQTSYVKIFLAVVVVSALVAATVFTAGVAAGVFGIVLAAAWQTGLVATAAAYFGMAAIGGMHHASKKRMQIDTDDNLADCGKFLISTLESPVMAVATIGACTIGLIPSICLF
jgi:hypothetical protein